MSTPAKALNLYTNAGKKLTPQEAAFISAYILCKNGSQAVREAGYKVKAPEKYGIKIKNQQDSREERR